MNELSARSVAPRPVDMIFNLPKPDLIPIVENAVEESPIRALEIQISHEKGWYKGGGSESVIPTFSYRTGTGQSGTITMFVKRQIDPQVVSSQ